MFIPSWRWFDSIHCQIFISDYRLTVRTLVFHSSNVGSIPSNPIIKLRKENLNKLLFNNRLQNNITSNLFVYEFSFVSLIPPFFSSLVLTTKPSIKNTINFKKSYLLLSWMYYLKTSKNLKKTKTVSFITLPVKRKQYTLQKAPMAHKTNSKEHYKFKFFFYKIIFSASIKNTAQLLSPDSGLFFTLLIKPFFPVFGTNLLLLSSYRLLFSCKTGNFLTYKLKKNG